MQNPNPNPNPNNTNEEMMTVINDLINKLIAWWEYIKITITENIEIFYNFLRVFTAKHLFSMIMVGTCIVLFMFVKIPPNWDSHLHHLYYFGLVILMGLALFRYDMEDIIDKDITTDDEEKIKYAKKRKEKNILMKKNELLRKLIANPNYIDKIKQDDRDLFGENNGDDSTKLDYQNLTASKNEIKERQDKITNVINEVDIIIQNINHIKTGINNNMDDSELCTKVKVKLDTLLVDPSNIPDDLRNMIEPIIDNIKRVNDSCNRDEIETYKTAINKTLNESKTELNKLKSNFTKEELKKGDVFMTDINSKIRDLKENYKKKKEEGEKIELIKARQRNIPKTLLQQFKAYFKYLSITSCVVFLLFLVFKIYQGSGSTVKYGIHMLVVSMFIGLLFFVTYSISSKRSILLPSWAKTSSSKEIGVKEKEDEKIKQNNNPDRKGFTILRILTRPFIMIFYLLYGMMCNIRDFFSDLRDPSKRALKKKHYQQWKDQNLSYIVIIVLGLSFLFMQYVMPYADRLTFDIYSTTLLRNPVYLEKLKVIGKEEQLKETSGRNFSFCLSAWIYLEESNANHNFSSNMNATIINYGELPHLTYNVKTNTATVFLKKGKDVKQVIYQTSKLAKQKWHQVVFNYDHGLMDIFVNGELVSTTSGIIPYMTNDEIYVGQYKGIRGGIKDVVYHFKNRTKMSIETSYYFSKFRSYLML